MRGAVPANGWVDALGAPFPGAGEGGAQDSKDAAALLRSLRGVLAAVEDGHSSGTQRHAALDEGIALAQRLVAACDAREGSGATPA